MSDERTRIQQEIIDSLPNPCHGLLNLAPRVGKTKIGIDIIKREKPKKILWVTVSAKLRDVDIPKEFLTWKAKTYLNRTKLICYKSLHKEKGHYDLIIFDEYQEITPYNAEPILSGRVTYKNIIGLSGTHPTHKDKNEVYANLGLKIVSAMSIDEAVDNNLIAPYKITVVTTRLDSVDRYIKAGSRNKTFYQTEKNQYDYYSKLINIKHIRRETIPQFYYLNRMRVIYNSIAKKTASEKILKKLEGRTLIFSATIKQCEELCDNTYHSKTDNKKLEQFVNGEIDTLACVNSGGVGYTFRDVDNLFITQVNSNKKGDATQKLARSLVLQEGYTANIIILCAEDTTDLNWVQMVLEDFDEDKVSYVSLNDFLDSL